MNHCSRVATAVTALALLACGKSTKDQPAVAEAKGVEGRTATATAPAGTPGRVTPPAKAPARGPERPVYSLVDNRLSAHLTRGGGLFVPAGSAGFAKYIRFGNMMAGGSSRRGTCARPRAAPRSRSCRARTAPCSCR